MRPPRPFALLRTRDQWSRCSHFRHRDRRGEPAASSSRGGTTGTSLPPGDAADAAGLAFDHECRLYRSIPAEGRVRAPALGGWTTRSALATAQATPLDLLEGPPRPAGTSRRLLAARRRSGRRAGSPSTATTGCSSPRPTPGAILVYDLWNRRLAGRIGLVRPSARAPSRSTSPPARTSCCACSPTADSCGSPLAPSLCRSSCVGRPDAPPDAEPRRLAVSPGGLLVVLLHRRRRSTGGSRRRAGGFGSRSCRAGDRPRVHRRATARVLVVARAPGDDFLRFRIDGTARDRDAPLKARGYDGSAIVRTPDGRIGFWTDRGLREAVVARSRFATDGPRHDVPPRQRRVPHRAGAAFSSTRASRPAATSASSARPPTTSRTSPRSRASRRRTSTRRSCVPICRRRCRPLRSHRRRPTPVCRSTGARPGASCRGRASTRTTRSRPTRRPCSPRRAATSG